MAKKILVLSPSWIGDCVMTQPMLRRLSELHPDCVIDVFAPKWSQAVYRRMDEVNEILDNPFGHGALQLRERWRVGRMLGKRGYDQVIATAGSLKMGFLAFATGIRQRTGYVGEQRYGLLNDIRKLDKAALPLMVDRYTALAHESQAAFNGQFGQACDCVLPRRGIRRGEALAAAPLCRHGAALRATRLSDLAVWLAQRFCFGRGD